jgi:hypothetical protein
MTLDGPCLRPLSSYLSIPSLRPCEVCRFVSQSGKRLWGLLRVKIASERGEM